MLKQEYRIYLRYFYLGSLLIAVLFFSLDYLPIMGEMSQLSARIDIIKNSVKTLSKEEKEKQQQQLQFEIDKLNEKFQIVTQAAEGIKGRATTERNIPLVTLQIEDLANLSKIELTLIKPLVSEGESLHEILPIEIGFQSTYARLIDFILLLEKSPLLLSVRDLVITRNDAIYPALEVKLVLDVLFCSQDDKVFSEENADVKE